ncbi:MAG: hypothetical protein AAFU73_23235 [Planctomycetota bacterium]
MTERASEGANGARPEVGLCVGKDCRKHGDFGPLRAELRASCDVLDLPCLDLCKGPVVVVDPRSDKACPYARLRKPKLQRDAAERAAGGAESDRLKKARVRGRKREKMLKRLRRALKR